MEAARAVLVTYDRDGRPFRASGLHVRDDVVLTADHCADGSQYTVWRSGRGHPATVVWRSHTTDVDLAVLRAEGLPPVRTMPMARLDRTHAEFLDGCTCLCFPAFKRPDLGPGGRGAGPAAGDDPVAQLVGGIPLAEGLRARHGAGAGTVGDGNAVLLVDSGRSVLPRAEDAPELVNTAWQGASGGGVVVASGDREFCVGVVSAREVKETPQSLHVATVGGIASLPAEDAAAFLELMAVEDLSRVTVLTGGRPTRRQVVTGHRPERAPDYVVRSVEATVRALLDGAGGGTQVTLRGLRGAGKSQVAAEVARGCQERGWRVVAWVNAQTPESVESGLRALADALGHAREDEPAPASIRRMLDVWRSDPDSQRLLVFDDLSEAAPLAGMLPDSASASVLVTTATGAVSVGQVVEVGGFTLEEAVAYLEACTRLGDPDGAARLADELGAVAVALAQAGSTMARRRLTYGSYLKALARMPLGTVLTPEPGQVYPDSAAVALGLSLEAALAASTDPDLTRAIVDVLALLDPRGVPRAWFSALGDEFVLGGSLALLEESSLVLASDDGAALLMHGLVARAVREGHADPEASSRAAAAAATLLTAVELETRAEFWDRRDRAAELAAHFLAVLDRAVPDPDPRLIQAAVDCAGTLNALGDPYLAARLLEVALTASELFVGEDDPQTFAARDALAGAYQSRGDTERAVPLFERNVADRERVQGAEHPDTLIARNNLGLSLLRTSNRARGLQLMEQAVDGLERVQGPDHRDSVTVRGNLARAVHQMGDPQRAVPMFEDLLADLERVVDPGDQMLLACLSNLAMAQQATGDLEAATRHYERALAASEEALGPDDTTTLTLVNNLGGAHRQAGELDRAIPLFERAVDGSARVLGPRHPDTLRNQNNLARALWDAGRHGEAQERISAAVETAGRELGNGHAITRLLRQSRMAMLEGEPGSALR